jgi:hypothetical protein
VKVRIKDAASTEVTVDVGTAVAASVDEDVFLESSTQVRYSKRGPAERCACNRAAITLLTGYWLCRS